MEKCGFEVTRSETGFGRFIDSFKRNPNARVTTEALDAEGKPLPDQPPAEPALAMKLKQRHLQMIAIGGSIGSSLSMESLRLADGHQGLACLSVRGLHWRLAALPLWSWRMA